MMTHVGFYFPIPCVFAQEFIDLELDSYRNNIIRVRSGTGVPSGGRCPDRRAVERCRKHRGMAGMLPSRDTPGSAANRALLPLAHTP